MNKKLYGTSVPPLYDLSKISIDIAIFNGDVDDLSDPEDVEWLKDESHSGLPSQHLVFQKMYHLGHGSFMMGKEKTYITDLLKLLEKY